MREKGLGIPLFYKGKKKRKREGGSTSPSETCWAFDVETEQKGENKGTRER